MPVSLANKGHGDERLLRDVRIFRDLPPSDLSAPAKNASEGRLEFVLENLPGRLPFFAIVKPHENRSKLL